MLLSRAHLQLVFGACLSLSGGALACSLQMPSESDVFGSAGADSDASGGAPSATGGRGQSGGDDQAGAAAVFGDAGSVNAASGASNGSSGAGAGGASNASSGSTGSAGASGATAFDPAAGLVAYFAFDEASGALAANGKDSSKSAKCVGTCTHPAGHVGRAFGIRNDERTTDWVELPANLFAGHAALTLSIWFRDLSASRSSAPLFHFSATSKDALYLIPDDRNTQPSEKGAHLGGVRAGSSFVDLWGATLDLTDQEWHQVVVSWSSASIDLYSDARLVGSKSNPNAAPSQLAAASTNYLGRARNADNRALFGELDELRIYDRALSALQVQQLYNVR
jgi:hypothetical protein